MSHPVLWPQKTFFYPIGNTAPVLLTQDLPPEAHVKALLLGCGDPRHILYMLYAEKDNVRQYDFTCCDYEPGVLARNVLLLTLIIDGQTPDVLWNIFYHFKLDALSLGILTSQSRKLADLSADAAAWTSCPYASTIRFSTISTIQRLHSFWKKYAEAINFTNVQQQHYSDAFKKIFNGVTAGGLSDQEQYFNFSIARSAGPFWHSAVEAMSRNIPWYWRTGIIQRDEEKAKHATLVNPTFLYSVLGDNCIVHYGTYPLQAFHIAEAYISLPEKSVTEHHIVQAATKQFERWCHSFKKTSAAGRCRVRFFTGDAIAFCHALHLHQVSGFTETSLNESAWSGKELVLNSEEYMPGTDKAAPSSFNIIETSNIIDHLALLNLLVVVAPLLIYHPSATLYTETLLVEGDDSHAGLLRRLCADMPTIALLFGLAPIGSLTGFSSSTNVNEVMMFMALASKQYHERLSWKTASSGEIHPFRTVAAFEPEGLARVLFELYYQMFKDVEDVAWYRSNLSSIMSNAKTSILDGNQGIHMKGVIHYHRSSFVMLLQLCKFRIQCDWEKAMDLFFDMLNGERRLMLNSNYYQEFCGQLHLRGIYTVWALTPAAHANLLHPAGIFSGWNSIPPLVCVVLLIPRTKLKALEDMDPSELGSPMMECVIKGADSHNIFSDVQMVFGKVVVNDGETTIEEDEAGFLGSSSLVMSAWVPSHALQRAEKCTVGLGIHARPAGFGKLNQVLGPLLNVFEADSMDRTYVHVLVSRPNRLNEAHTLSLIAHSERRTGPVVSVTTTQHRVSELSMRWDIVDADALEVLPDASIGQEQSGPSTITITLNSSPAHNLVYPFPVDAARARLRIARKSKFVEVIAPIAWTAVEKEVASLQGRILGRNEERLPIPWSIHSVRLNQSPVIQHSAFRDYKMLNTHLGAGFSSQERLRRTTQGSQDAIAHVKDTLLSFFMYASQPNSPRIFQLSDPEDGGYLIIYLNDLRLDLSCHTFIADVCVFPMTASTLMVNMDLMPLFANSSTRALQTKENEAVAWKYVLPAFVERCRTWSHKSSCKYRKQRAKIPLGLEIQDNPICSCGEGKDLGRLADDRAWKPLAKYMTRAAISPLFAVQYLEPKAGVLPPSATKIPSGPTTKTQPKAATIPPVPKESCANCKKQTESKLLACSKCKSVKYCDSKCQLAHWKQHKKSCR